MPDQFSETTTTGYGSRIVNSITGIIIGIILFIAAFGVLYWNEGRLDLSNVAKKAPEISSSQLNTDASINGSLVSISGSIEINDQISDGLFLKPMSLVALYRTVEMYSWVEETESTSQKNVGGSETTNITYNYKKGWKENPENSSNFKYPEGHQNPMKTLNNTTSLSKKATLGVYNLDLSNIDLPITTKVLLNSDNTNLSQSAVLSGENYIFLSKNTNNTINSPQVGDLRISYFALYPETNVTLFAKLNGNSFSPYFDAKNNKLYRIFIGGRDQAIATLHSEYTFMIWLFRLIGLGMLWFGLMLMLGPISVILDVLPIFGSISKGLISVLTFVVSLVLAGITILVAMILHNIFALIVVLIIAVIAIFFVMSRLKKKKTNMTLSQTNTQI